MRLSGKVAVVTGAARGIGKEIALTLAREGADVIINDINLEEAEKAAGEITAMGRRSMAIKADVSNSSEVNAMFQAIFEKFGQVDILVNNAGISPITLAWETTEEEWDRTVGIILKGTFNCCKAVMDHMMKRRSGKIINISSMSGKSGYFPSGVHYCAAKAGVIGLTKSLARHLGPYGINVNGVAPSQIDTPMIRWRTPEQMAELVKQVPLGRIGQTKDVANAVLFLASPESDFITGETINVTGGMYID